MEGSERVATARPAGKAKRAGKFLLRLAVSLLLLAIVYWNVDLPQLIEIFKRLSVTSVLALLVLYTAGQMLSALRWRVILENVKIHRSLSRLYQAYFLGMYVNTFGLGTVGGDVARSIAIQPKRGERAAALASVVADRVLGLAVLASIGAISVLIVKPKALGFTAEAVAIILVIVLTLGWWFGPKILLKLFSNEHRFRDAAEQIARAFPTRFRPFSQAVLIAAAFHCLQISMHLLLARALGVNELSLAYLFATVPFVNIVATLPFSINGLGVREAIYVTLFVPVGVSHEVAVAFGAIWILTATVVSAVGGIVVAQNVTGQISEDPNLVPTDIESSKAAIND